MGRKKKQTREEIYDADVSPLMAQVIEICKQKEIPFVASFDLGDDLRCTTVIAGEGWELPENLRRAADAMWQESKPLFVTVRNGQGEVTNVEAIFP